VPVVEDQGGVTGLREACGVSVQAQVTEGGEAVRQHHDRRVLDSIGPVQPRRARRALGQKRGVVADEGVLGGHGLSS
jgi:hypothetical protein